jgi:hypothetical protein
MVYPNSQLQISKVNERPETDMKKNLIYFLSFAFLTLAVQPSKSAETKNSATETEAKGKIVRFECGDNCYLVIQPEGTEELTGLCVADACTPWNEIAEMPAELIGKAVEVTIGTGIQYDGSGNEMGETTSFTKIVVSHQ